MEWRSGDGCVMSENANYTLAHILSRRLGENIGDKERISFMT